MAYNAAPSHWFASWSEDGTNITVPIASFPELTAGEADGATGDIRKVTFAILEKLYAAQQAEAQADRPTKMIVDRASSLNPSTGQIVRTFSITFTLQPATIDVAAES